MQDWEPVILKRPKIEVKKGPSGAPPKITRDDPDSFHIKTVPKETAQRIIQKRTSLKLTQDQLAQKVNLRPNIIKDIEACKGPYDPKALNKILNFLSQL